MADSRETRQQELARLLLHKARQDLDLVVSVVDSEVVADEIVGFHIQQAIEPASLPRRRQARHHPPRRKAAQ